MKSIEIKELNAAVFKDEEHKYPFLISENIDTLLKGINAAVQKNGWVYISGDVGAGKSEVTKYMQQRWQREPEKYVVVSIKAWLRAGSRVSALMKRLIAAIDPDEHIPGDIELRAERLKTMLMRAHREKRKVIVMIDEAQDLSDSTFRELKKVHETSAFGVPHLFSIIMFAKESMRAEGLLAGRELGYRIKRIPILPLSMHEMCEFAEKRFDLTFPTGTERRRVTAYFAQMAHPSPLGVRHLCEAINDMPEYKGVVSLEIIQGAMRRDLNVEMKKYRIPLKKIQQVAKEEHGLNIAISTISDVKAGKGDRYADKTVAVIDDIQRDLLRQAREQERRAM